MFFNLDGSGALKELDFSESFLIYWVLIDFIGIYYDFIGICGGIL